MSEPETRATFHERVAEILEEAAARAHREVPELGHVAMTWTWNPPLEEAPGVTEALIRGPSGAPRSPDDCARLAAQVCRLLQHVTRLHLDRVADLQRWAAEVAQVIRETSHGLEAARTDGGTIGDGRGS